MSRKDALLTYRKKRDFNKTSEPQESSPSNSGQRYLIQKHAATRLHYDFRLELDGALKSWAVTRGPSLDPSDKRLAVEVEDHPVSYGSFEGIIPKGQYGGGTVMLWDEGTWAPIGDPHEGIEKGKLVFELRGKRLRGEWTLARMPAREKDKGKHKWLLIKHRDKDAREGDDDALLNNNVTSVSSGRSMEEIASAEDRVRQSNGEQANGKEEKSEASGFIPPQLATLADAVPQGEQWVHEMKFDGCRAVVAIRDRAARIFTRTGRDWTRKFPTLAALLAKLSVKNATLDGEIVALGENGATSFAGLQEALSKGKDESLQYYVFDLLSLDGEDLTHQPLLERKARLEQLLKKKKLDRRVNFSEHFAAEGNALLKKMRSLHAEGIISKRVNAPYTSGRGASWMKTKCRQRQEFAIGGFTLPTHANRGVGALLLGYFDNGKFIYAGKVGTGFDRDASLRLRQKLDSLEQQSMAFDAAPASVKNHARWVRPRIVCEVEFAEWTTDGRLRHPSFQGLREDKPAASVQREAPLQANPKAKSKSHAIAAGDALVSGVRVSHPDRMVYPDSEITKKQLAEYYFAVANSILPHIKNRPLSVLRCPDGIGEKCFYQRHITRGQSPRFEEASVAIKGRKEAYITLEDGKGLLALVQWGVIELHPWGCLADDPERPDRMIFDLDPDPETSWDLVIEAAHEIRERMKEFGLESFVKTTGGKGLHVVVPLVRSYGWKPVKEFARAVAESMQRDNPRRYIAQASKEARKGKIFVDYLRNDLTATAVAPYSARAREGAPVALPISWKQLKSSLKPNEFTVQTVPALLAKRHDDPWADLFKTRQKIAQRYLKALKITTGA